MMVVGKSVFKCPKDGREVILHRDCIDCERFQFWGTRGSKPYVSCGRAEPEKKGIGGLKKW